MPKKTCPQIRFKATLSRPDDYRFSLTVVGLTRRSYKPWPHHPLAILNGCNTAAFSPDALSPFVTKLVRDRGAAGVIGTEIPVFEELAAGFAVAFLERFLAGASAGEALLGVRESLLQKRNPLGLVYTLYGAADLKLSHDGTAEELKRCRQSRRLSEATGDNSEMSGEYQRTRQTAQDGSS